MRLAAYAGVSTASAAGVLVKALSERPNFYSAAVFLAQSSANLMILTNFIFLCACLFMLGLQKLLYGPLRPMEIEQLYERGWLFVTETCLSMTIFRGSFGAWFMFMFFSLLAGKVWGWVGEGRVEILEQQPPANPRLFHTRLSVSLSISVLFATYMLSFSIRTVLAQAKPDMMVMFGFEFAILTILTVSTAARYAICLTEIQVMRKQKAARLEELRRERIVANEATTSEREGTLSATTNEPTSNVTVDEAEVEIEGWDGKGRWIFYLDLVTDFLKLIVYVTFFSVLLGFYGLPLHIMRDLFLSFRSFFKRVADFVRYRNATRDMNARYPDATPEEVTREDVCIICREEMRPIRPTNDGNPAPRRANPVTERMRPKKLPCGHILHFSCLRSWLERQQNCPTCRRPVLAPRRPQGAPENAAGPPGEAARQPGGPGAPHHVPGEVGQYRARVINLGPLRIGFGAGGGNLMEDLAQQIHDGEQRPLAPPAGNVADAHRHFGFGFGFGRRPHPSSPAASSPPPIQTQLDQIERTLRQQIRSLQLASNELFVVRLLQNELTRLRSLQGNDHDNGTAAALPQTLHPGLGPSAIHGQLQPPPIMLSSQYQPVLTSDSNGLPEGMTLPAGWTLLPLQRQDAVQGTFPTDASLPSLATANGARSTPLASTISPPDQPSAGPADISTTRPSTVPAVPVDFQPTVAVASTPTHAENLTLPSWGSASRQPDEHALAESNTHSPSAVPNGEAASIAGPIVPDSSEGKVEKGKGKAATVEDFPNDVD